MASISIQEEYPEEWFYEDELDIDSKYRFSSVFQMDHQYNELSNLITKFKENGNTWDVFALKIGRSESEIEEFEFKFSKGHTDVVREIIKKWQGTRDATMSILINVLKEMDNKKAVNYVLKQYAEYLTKTVKKIRPARNVVKKVVEPTTFTLESFGLSWRLLHSNILTFKKNCLPHWDTIKLGIIENKILKESDVDEWGSVSKTQIDSFMMWLLEHETKKSIKKLMQ